jgi:hypothetical protein
MPEVGFFLARDDEIRLVRRMLDLGCTMAVDRQYPTPEYKTLKSLVEYLELRQKGERLFFLLSSAYGRSPLAMDRIDEGPNEGKYFIKQRDGGPTIDFFCPLPFEKDGTTYIPSGMLGYYPTFWNTLTNRNEKTPAELKRLFSALSRELRDGAVRIDTGKRRYWVTPGVVHLRATGVKLAGISESLQPAAN